MKEDHYTLVEARHILGYQQCAEQGHSVLWIPMHLAAHPEFPSQTYQCLRCSRYLTTEYPPVITLTAFDQIRQEALRTYCMKANPNLSRGHKIIPVPLQWPRGHEFERRETYACFRCDVLIIFLETS